MEISASQYDLVTEVRDGYVFALVRTAVMRPEVYREVILKIRNAVFSERAGRLMFEYEAALVLNDEETFEFMNELTRLMAGMRIALVARDAKHLPSLEFVGAFGQETGRQVNSFTNTAAAEQWLLS
jgi:hypothetical protein